MANTDLQRFCDELRAKISIVDVVGSKIKLVRKGREYQACCPFHNEKTPSFTVNEAKGFYHCFGCGAHGDIIKFEMEANGLTFIEAVEKLAHKVGMQLPKLSPESKEQAEKRATAYDIMEMAAKFFEKNLRLSNGHEALDYLYGRGFDDTIIEKFRLGFAPNNNGLKALLSSRGISDSEMAELGLISIPEDSKRNPHDFFRNRVMIPIMDKRNRVIAFGGRVMDKSQPKYLNSPETPVFNKRRILYNLNYARESGYEAKRLIVCEGYMDVIAMDKYGIGYAVAPLGTALTEDQIQEAWKVVNEPICCFDGDSAGIRAAVRSVDRVLPILKPGYSLQYAFLPDKMDPDEFLKDKGADEFLKTVTDTTPLKELLWKKTLEGKALDTPEQKARIEKEVKEEVAKITDETVKNYYIREMKDKIYNELIGKQKVVYQNNVKKTFKEKLQIRSYKTDLDDLVGKYIVSALVCYPQLVEEYEERLLDFTIKDDNLRAMYEDILEIMRDNIELKNENELIDILKSHNFEKVLKEKTDLTVLKKQCPDIIKMRADLNSRLVEIQLKRLDNEIRECKRLLAQGNFSDEDYLRYETYKKERNAILSEADNL
ncbi:MAG: DNA primase [Alphaproteobacteria bacterium]|nr:DNA primase [Alphaproteobacteria bacterium]